MSDLFRAKISPGLSMASISARADTSALSSTPIRKSAVSARTRARRTPSASITLSVSRRPAVSDRRTGKPPMTRLTSTISRVVPASPETIAASFFDKLLINVDFPAFGGPMTAISRPWRTRSPARLPARDCVKAAAKSSSPCPARRASLSGTSSSSGKSISPSTAANASSIASRQSL